MPLRQIARFRRYSGFQESNLRALGPWGVRLT